MSEYSIEVTEVTVTHEAVQSTVEQVSVGENGPVSVTISTVGVQGPPGTGGGGGTPIPGPAGEDGQDGQDGIDGVDGEDAVWTQMTQAAYDALPSKDPNTLYIVVG